MKVNDAIWGALFLLLCVVLLVHVQSFPKIPGQQYGPAIFPGVVATALGVCAVLLIFKGMAARAQGSQPTPWIAFDSWTRSHRHVVALAVTIGINIFYIVAVGSLGFILTGVVYLGALFAVFGVRTRWIFPLALVATLVIHTAFYKLLRVPLPWGVLQPILW
jgi:putative tricarboxylic transport membrane protein